MRLTASRLLPTAALFLPLACVQQPEPEPAVEPVPSPVVVAQPAPAPVTPATPVPATPTPIPTPTPTPAPAQPAPARRPDGAVGFVVLRNADTLAAERYTRTGTRVAGELVIASAGIRQTYAMTLRPTATVSRFETAAYRVSSPSDAPPIQSLVARFDDTGAIIEAGGQTTPHAAPPGILPFINLSGAVIEQILMRAKAIGGASAEVPVLVLAGGQNTTATVSWVGADSAIIILGPELRVAVSPTGEFRGGIVPAQGVSFVRDPSAPRPTSQARDYSAPAGAPYRAEEVRLRNAEARIGLAGTLTLPAVSSGTRVPAVVLITGSGQQDRDEASPGLRGWKPFRQIADTLGRRGIAVLRIDDRGVGGSDAGSPDATTMDFAGDIRAAVAYLRSRPDIDARRIALLGHSEGAQIAPIVAAEDTTLRAIVLIAGPSRVGRAISDSQVAHVMSAQNLQGAAREAALRANDAARDSPIASNGWIRYWMSYDPLPVARRVRVPVLILQGATDRQVTADQAEELAAAVRSSGNRDVTVRVFPDMNHLLVHDPDGGYAGYAKLTSLEVRKDLLGAVADWLATKLGSR